MRGIKTKVLFSCWIIAILSLAISQSGFSQKVVLVGMVKDSLKQPLSYANIIAKPKNPRKNLQFAISDKDGKYRLIFQKGDSITLHINYLGFKPLNYRFVASKSLNKDFILTQSTEKLDEIIIETPITVRGDTTTYQVKSFLTGEERRLKNVLKKLPGIEVDNDGGVKVLGKKVTKLYVDGKKFFNGGTKLAVENIPADVISKIQVIDNFNEIAFLKNLSDTEDLAMNIELKEDRKRFVFGDIEISKGFDDFYKADANLFYYSPRTNVNYIGDLNNIAEKSFSFKDYINFEGGINSIFNKSLPINLKNYSQFIENKDVIESVQRFSALNINQTSSSKLNLSGYLIVNNSEEKALLETQNDYTLFNEIRSNNTDNKNIFGIGKINLEYKPNFNEHMLLRVQLKRTGNNNDNNISSTVSNQTNIISSLSDLNETKINSNFEWHKRFSENHTFSSAIDYNYIGNKSNSSWLSENNFLEGLIPVEAGQDILLLLQTKEIRRENFDVIIKHFWEINNHHHIYTSLGNYFQKQSFISDDRQQLDDGTINSFSNFEFGNNLEFALNNFFLGLHYKFRRGIFTFKQGVFLRNLNWKVNQNNNLTNSKWLLLPDLLAKIEFNRSKKLEFNYNLSTSFTDVSSFANRFILTSYNSVFRGNENLENNLFHSVSLFYSQFSLFKGLVINGSLSYSKQRRGVRNVVDFENVNQFLTTQMFTNPNENFMFRGNLTKKINNIRYKFEASTSLSKFLQEIDQNLETNQNNNYSYKFGFETLFKTLPTIELGFKRSVGNFISSESRSKFRTNEPYFSVNYDFLKGFIFSLDYTSYDFKNKALNQRNRFDIANFTLSYQKENSAWTYKVFSNNLLNTVFKRNSSFSQYLISDTKTFILPRVLMFSIGYNL